MKLNKILTFNEFINESSCIDCNTFKNMYNITLDESFTKEQVNILLEVFKVFKTHFIKDNILNIRLQDLGAIHGQYTPEIKELVLNPNIFDYKTQYGSGDNKVSSYIHTIIHEIGHAIDGFRLSLSKEWLDISDWKQHPIDNKVPDGYKRYIETRPGRTCDEEGNKKSDWIYKEETEFVKEYSKKSPFEDFADCFSFVVLGFDNKFKGESGKLKLNYIKNILDGKTKISNPINSLKDI